MKRILFVDDERMVLDGLRALLRPQRAEWDMVFVDGGIAALGELARGPFDVIVTDMKMPGMDGAALLNEVQKRHPGVVRIVLSGHAEIEMTLRSVPVAHQFLIKPCDAKALKAVVDCACRLQTMVDDPAVRRYVGRLQHLPTLPTVYFDLMRALQDENVGMDELAAIVEGDPSLCAKVLQLVNSPFIGLGREVVSLRMAVSYIGMKMLKDLTLAAHVFSPRGGNRAVAGQLEGLRRHSLLVGGLARRLAEGDRRLADDVFTAGLLHDIGKLVLVSECLDAYSSIMTAAATTRRPASEIELEVLGVTHAQIGGYLIGIWGLPYSIVEAVAAHHLPGALPMGPGLDASAIVYIANALVNEQDERLGVGDMLVPIDVSYLQSMGVLDRLPAWREMAAALVDRADAGTDGLAA
jgi:HD-like signal output (HDOD) protein